MMSLKEEKVADKEVGPLVTVHGYYNSFGIRGKNIAKSNLTEWLCSLGLPIPEGTFEKPTFYK